MAIPIFEVIRHGSKDHHNLEVQRLHKTDGHLIEYFRNRFIGGVGNYVVVAVGSGLEITGGVISEYTDNGSVYRSFIFSTHQVLL